MTDARAWRTTAPYVPPASTGSWRTHDGGGVVDLRSRDLFDKGLTIPQVLLALRRSGFAAWFRSPAQGFDPHIHAVALGDREASPQAAAQEAAYRNGRNGLASNGPDDGPRLEHIRVWELVKRIVRVKLAQADLDRWRAEHSQP